MDASTAIQMSVDLESWSMNSSGSAFLDVFAMGDEYHHFAQYVHWPERAKGFWASLTVTREGSKDDIVVPNAYCVQCAYVDKQVAWIRRDGRPDLVPMVFRVDGNAWQTIVRIYPLLRQLERASDECHAM